MIRTGGKLQAPQRYAQCNPTCFSSIAKLPAFGPNYLMTKLRIVALRLLSMECSSGMRTARRLKNGGNL